MLYFEDNKNRNILALFFTCLALIECIFFGFAIEGLYSFLYPFILNFLSVFIIACLCHFLDFTRKMNAVFVFLGLFISVLFIQLCFLYFEQGTENGFYMIPSLLFIKSLLLQFLFFSLCLISNGLYKLKWKNNYLKCFLPLISYAIYSLLFNNILLSFFGILIFVLAFFFTNHLDGIDCVLSRKHVLILFIIYFFSMFLFFAYNAGLLLTQEVCAFFNLIIILVGIVLSIRRRRFGLYLIEFITLLMSASYLFIFLENTNLYYLNVFGIIPLSIIGLGAIYIDKRL